MLAMTNLNTSFVLTDELERQLMLEAMEEQFRPHPLRALFAGLRKLARAAQAAGKTAGAETAPAA